MHTFDVHGWNYLRPEKQMKALARKVLSISNQDPQIFWKVGGGKGFGLCLCDALVLSAKDFTVPAWLGLEYGNKITAMAALEEWKREHHGKIITRSSHFDEDFRDPRSGVHDSFQFQLELCEGTVEKIFAYNIPFVVQKMVKGIGFVVDIGYSRLLKKPVVKFAHGGFISSEAGMIFTSATWDFESRFGLYGVSGKPIIPLEEIIFQEMAPSMSVSLVRAIKTLGINFGVQLELIIDPFESKEKYLVQVRPSPGNVRGRLAIPHEKGKLIGTTLKVNKVGSVSGRLMNLSAERDLNHISDLMEVAKNGYDDSRHKNLKNLIKGKVILWSDLGLTRGELVKIVYAASSLGAVGQLSFRTLFHNSWHKKVRIYAQEGKIKYEKDNKKNILMAISKLAYGKLAVLAKMNKAVRLISDGMVGQIFEV